MLRVWGYHFTLANVQDSCALLIRTADRECLGPIRGEVNVFRERCSKIVACQYTIIDPGDPDWINKRTHGIKLECELVCQQHRRYST
jgi:hypothetical protein